MELFWDAIREALQLFAGFDRYLVEVIGVSFWVSGSAALLGLLLGVPLGVILGTYRFRGRGVLAALVNTGLAMPPVVAGLFVYMLISRRGPLGSLQWLYTTQAMVLAQVLLSTPYIAALTMAAMGSVPRELRLQAMALGASRWQATWLCVRQARISIMAAVIAGFGAVISEVGAVMMVGGNIATQEHNETRVMTSAIVLEVNKGNFAKAMALGIFLLSLAFVLMVILTRLQQGARGKWLQS